MPIRSLLIVSCLLASTSCLSQTPPETVRWFMPAVDSFELDAGTDQRPMRLLPMASRSHLREAMVWRLSPVELFFDEQERWGARPADIVQGVFEDALFANGPFVRSEARDAIALSIELHAFEGVYAQDDMAVCEVFVVHDDGQLVRQKKFRVTSPLSSREPDELARALGKALGNLAVQLRDWAQTSG